MFEAIQLWVNLPARLKMTAPKYQPLTAAQIPTVPLDGDAGTLRVIAGTFGDVRGPAETFTPMNLWDMQLNAGHGVTLQTPEGHAASVFVRKGKIRINGTTTGSDAQLVVLGPKGEGVRIDADTDALVMVLSGEPIDEPVFGYGPFVMNTEAEIRRAIVDFNNGRMGRLAP